MARALGITISTIIAACVFLASDARAHPAWGIVADRQGQIYFSDLEATWRIDARGRLSVFRAGVSGRHTHDLNTDEAGNLYGADNSYEPATQRFFSAVWQMTPAGDFSYLLAPTDNPPKGTSIWRDRDGNMYHATFYPERELLVLKRTPSGDVTVLVGSSNAAREYRQGVPYSVGGMALGTDGSLYLTDRTNIHKVTAAGAVTTLARNIAAESSSDNSPREGSGTSLLGLTVDAQGNVFAADLGNRRVLKITPDGRVATLIRAEQSWLPTGVAFRNGDLYILEHGFTPPRTSNGTRVRKLSPDGSVTVLATAGEKETPAVRASSTSENTAPTVEPKQNAPYALLGVAVGIFALTVVVWRVRRRRYKHEY